MGFIKNLLAFLVVGTIGLALLWWFIFFFLPALLVIVGIAIVVVLIAGGVLALFSAVDRR